MTTSEVLSALSKMNKKTEVVFKDSQGILHKTSVVFKEKHIEPIETGEPFTLDDYLTVVEQDLVVIAE